VNTGWVSKNVSARITCSHAHLALLVVVLLIHVGKWRLPHLRKKNLPVPLQLHGPHTVHLGKFGFVPRSPQHHVPQRGVGEHYVRGHVLFVRQPAPKVPQALVERLRDLRRRLADE